MRTEGKRRLTNQVIWRSQDQTPLLPLCPRNFTDVFQVQFKVAKKTIFTVLLDKHDKVVDNV